MVGGLALQQAQYLRTPLENTTLISSEQRPREPSPCPLSLHQVKTMEELKQVHARFIKLGLDRDPRQAGELLSACALSEWGSMDYACSIFLELDDPGTFDYNTMIRAHVNHCDPEPEAALLLYIDMVESGVSPDNFTFPFALKACSQLSCIREGSQIHGHAIKFGFEPDVYTQNSLINMYGKCGEMKLSSKVFDQMGIDKTVASWSAFLAAHSRMGLWSDCLQLFSRMSSEGWQADESTVVSVLTSCANLGVLDLGRSIHCSLLRNFSRLNVVVETALIDMYMKCGQLDKGQEIFDRMAEKNVCTYSVLISGLAMQGDGREALRVFSSMLRKGIKPDEAIYVGVLSACSRAGLLEDGLRCFDRMRFEHRIMPTIQHYGCMVDLMARAGRLCEAYKLIRSMPMEPHDAAWRSLSSACKVHGNLELAEIATRNLVKLDSQNAGDYVVLSNIYARAHRWDDAARVRTEIQDKSLSQAPGLSRVEVKGRMHTFVSHDKSHPQSEEIYEMLYQMEWQLKFEGYSPDTSQVSANVDEHKKRRIISGHSQKLAIAFALLSTSQGSTIRILTNLRISSECHTYTALISKIFEREIIVQDRHRFHRFSKGECTCGGYW